MPTKKIDVSLENLLESGAHFGHQYRRWHPKMKPYLYAVKEGVYIFDLIKTKSALEEALAVLTKASKEGKTILLVGTKKQIKEKIKSIAEDSGCPYVNERWLGGTLTNFDQIKKSRDKLSALKEELASAKEKGYTKKERLLLERKIEKLLKSFGGILDLNGYPDLIVIVDIHREKGALVEAEKLNIPVLAIVDSNSNPELVDWIIPMNDDATKALEYVLDLIKEAIQEGKKKTVKKSEK